MSFVVKSYFIWNGETWTWSGDFIVSFHQCNLNNSSAELHFWSPFGFVHNWCNRQQYTNPRLSAFIIKLQYHFLPVKLCLRSDKAWSTKSMPPIHLLYALRLWYVDTFLALFPLFYISYRLDNHSMSTNRYNIVVPSNQFNLITWFKVLILSFVHFLEFFDRLQLAIICSVCLKDTCGFEAFFRKSFHELVRWEEVVKKNMVIWRISTRGKWRCNNRITQGFVTITTVLFSLINCYTIWKTSITC